MAELGSSQFILPGVLRAIGRKLLEKFLAHFQPDLAAVNIALPPPDLPDEEYFKAVSALLTSEAHLPEGLTKALFTIEEMASPEGQEGVRSAIAHAGLRMTFDADSTPEGIN